MPSLNARPPLLPATEAAMNRYLNAVRFSDGSSEDRDYAFQLKREYDALAAVDPANMEAHRQAVLGKAALYLSVAA